jgi:pilus assembly protein CpaE
MPPHITLLIIDKDSASRATIEAIIKPFSDTLKISAACADFSEAMKVIQKAPPSVVLMEVDDIQRGAEEIHHIVSHFPRTSVIVSAAEKSSEWILTTMRAGAVEYLLRPIMQEELLQSLRKVGRFWFEKPAEEVKEGKIVAVYNPIGGMGATTISVNLAASLAEDEKKVALVDLNLHSGDISTFLDVNPAYTLSSVTNNISRLDASFLMSVMTRHSSGPYVLTEPLDVEESLAITPEQIHRLLAFLKGIFDYVIIDCGGHLEGCNLAIFESVKLLLYTTILSLPAINNTKRYLLALDKRGLRQDKVKLVVNRYLSNADILVKDAEKVLGRKVFSAIPNVYTDVVNSINKGIPLVKMMPRSPVAKAIVKLAEQVK